jgi:chemotaxis protein CheD
MTEQRHTKFVHPGEMCVSDAPLRIVTVVGSCVAVCLFDRVARVGGLVHFVLPERSGLQGNALRFGSEAISKLIQALRGWRADTRRLDAKVFGGAAIAAGAAAASGSLGERNARVALAELARVGIPVVGQDTGGARGRKLLFHPDEGRAWVRAV